MADMPEVQWPEAREHATVASGDQPSYYANSTGAYLCPVCKGLGMVKQP